jgi:hypothetical protein
VNLQVCRVAIHRYVGPTATAAAPKPNNPEETTAETHRCNPPREIPKNTADPFTPLPKKLVIDSKQLPFFTALTPRTRALSYSRDANPRKIRATPGMALQQIHAGQAKYPISPN